MLTPSSRTAQKQIRLRAVTRYLYLPGSQTSSTGISSSRETFSAMRSTSTPRAFRAYHRSKASLFSDRVFDKIHPVVAVVPDNRRAGAWIGLSGPPAQGAVGKARGDAGFGPRRNQQAVLVDRFLGHFRVRVRLIRVISSRLIKSRLRVILPWISTETLWSTRPSSPRPDTWFFCTAMSIEPGSPTSGKVF